MRQKSNWCKGKHPIQPKTVDNVLHIVDLFDIPEEEKQSIINSILEGVALEAEKQGFEFKRILAGLVFLNK